MSDKNYLSQKNIDPKERLIFALDVGSNEEAKALVEELGDTVVFYKIGLQLFMGGNYLELVDWLIARGKKVFVDLKFYDVPQTVQSAIQELSKSGATFATVHGNDEILKAAASVKKDMKILAVTVLTSLDEKDMQDLGLPTNIEIKDLVLSRAKRAIQIGCDGVISSGIEALDLRAKQGHAFIIISPGIRPFKNTDDQKRTVDVEEAFHNGADYIVVGRPIREHTGFNSRQEATNDIQQRIRAIFYRI